MAGINNRIFGSDLTARVKAKLTARQNLADKQISPNESVSNNQRAKDYAAKNWASDHTVSQDEIDIANYTYDDILGNINFDNIADLSSRTPFVRMWTAVEIRTHSDTGERPEKMPPKKQQQDEKDKFIYEKQLINFYYLL